MTTLTDAVFADNLLDNVWKDGASLAGGSYLSGRNPNAVAEAKQAILQRLGEARYDGIKEGVNRATGGYSYTKPMKSERTHNTAFKLYSVKFFNTKIKERREALLMQLATELAHLHTSEDKGGSDE